MQRPASHEVKVALVAARRMRRPMPLLRAMMALAEQPHPSTAADESLLSGPDYEAVLAALLARPSGIQPAPARRAGAPLRAVPSRPLERPLRAVAEPPRPGATRAPALRAVADSRPCPRAAPPGRRDVAAARAELRREHVRDVATSRAAQAGPRPADETRPATGASLAEQARAATPGVKDRDRRGADSSTPSRPFRLKPGEAGRRADSAADHPVTTPRRVGARAAGYPELPDLGEPDARGSLPSRDAARRTRARELRELREADDAAAYSLRAEVRKALYPDLPSLAEGDDPVAYPGRPEVKPASYFDLADARETDAPAVRPPGGAARRASYLQLPEYREAGSRAAQPAPGEAGAGRYLDLPELREGDAAAAADYRAASRRSPSDLDSAAFVQNETARARDPRLPRGADAPPAPVAAAAPRPDPPRLDDSKTALAEAAWRNGIDAS